MKKIFKSPWLIAFLGVALGVGTQAVVLVMKVDRLELHATPRQDEPVGIVDRIQWSFLTPAIEEMKNDLEARLREAAERKTELDEYAARLAAEKSEIDKLKRDLEAMRAGLAGTFFEIHTVEERNLKTLAATYTRLTPAAALAIFREMDNETVVKILAFMRPEPVGLILEEMTRTRDGEDTLAGRAAVISNMLRMKREIDAQENT